MEKQDEEQVTVQIEDNNPEEEKREVATVMMEMEEVQNISPLLPIHVQNPMLQIIYKTSSSATKTTTGSTSMRHHDKFKMNIVQLSAGLSFECSAQPFSQGLSEIS